MQLSPWTFVGILALIWAVNRIVKEYVISRKLRQDYQRKLHSVLTDPNAQPKGRFE
ncbi:hypothetical protein HY493_05135 [Candidatus Woesearchaeota archaeon]|nr:hypothetical protein [Candidatus Woesearchaeota archaeon]